MNSELPVVDIDEQFLYYTHIIDNMDSIQRYCDVGPIRINLHSLINQIRDLALEWKDTLGEVLLKKVQSNLKNLKTYIIVNSIILNYYYTYEIC